VAGAAFVAVGTWAFVSPRSFFLHVATFPPYNRHFLHDLGALEVGIGVVLVLAGIQRDALVAALLGAGAGTAVHAVGHFEDAALGGGAWDPWVLVGFAALLFAGGSWRWFALRR
jgi:hypothetical protein